MATTTLASNNSLTTPSTIADASIVVWKYEFNKTIKIPPFGPTISLSVGVYVDYFPATKSFDFRISASLNGHTVSKSIPFQGSFSVTLPLPLGCSLSVSVNNFNFAGGLLSFDVSLSAHIPVIGTIHIYTAHVSVRIPTDAELAELYAAPATIEEFGLRLSAME
jgi:hypothetical protein